MATERMIAAADTVRRRTQANGLPSTGIDVEVAFAYALTAAERYNITIHAISWAFRDHECKRPVITLPDSGVRCRLRCQLQDSHAGCVEVAREVLAILGVREGTE
jgi:hypothetical protein